MKKKLILSLSAISVATPITVVSCSNPFKDTEGIKNAKFQYNNNNIFKNKSYAQFESQYLSRLYPQNTQQEKEDYKEVSKVFKRFFDNIDDVLFFDMQLFHQKFILLGNKLNNVYSSVDEDGDVERRYAALNKNSLIALMQYMYDNTPYSYNVLNKVWDGTKYRDIDTFNENIVFEFNKSPVDTEIDAISIIPNEVFEIFRSNEFRNNPNFSNFKLAYRKIIDTYQMLIHKIDEHEHPIQKALAPIYYVLKNPTPNKYINENYASTIAGKYALIKPKEFAKLGDAQKRITEFTKDPITYFNYLKENKFLNDAFNATTNKFKQTFDEAIDAWKQGIGKYGFVQLIAFSLYLDNPTNIQILAFNKNGDKTYMVEYNDGTHKYLFNAIADFQNSDKTSLTIYENKDQLQAQGYTLSEDTFSLFAPVSSWK
ncbi:hypothetical protein [Mycoplasma sp. HS2188]|uniref:hypothetical protein n=1 Tax=Mycoplasma sp. HS2188 TaxID=2976765 RepID=UPI0021AA56BA|nr:hypothetical protein [Mycoplasma sp. HS2188]MCT4469946.1 hypothetical protein [Mycoplasma sp. HS2188]